MTRRIYLSGPMTGIYNKNYSAFMKAAKALRKAGYFVISPWDLELKNPFDNWEACMQRDIREMMSCHSIATLPNWRKSRGASLEVLIGKTLKYDVHSVAYFLNRRHLCLL